MGTHRLDADVPERHARTAPRPTAPLTVPDVRVPPTGLSANGQEQVSAVQHAAGNRTTTAWLASVQRNKDGKDGKGGKGGKDDAEDSRLDKLVQAVKDSRIADLSEKEIQLGLDLWYSKRTGGADNIDLKKRRDIAGGTSVGGGGGAYVRGAVGHTENVNSVGMTYEQYHALMELGAYVGVSASAKAKAYARLGESAHVIMTAGVDAFAGAVARARGDVSVTMVGDRLAGVDASGSAKAMAGATVTVDISSQIAAKPGSALQGVGLQTDISGTAMAGAEATAEGEFAIDPLRGTVAVSGKASAFAGAKVTGTIKDSALLYNRKFLTLTVTGEASAGAGGEVKGGFSVRGGKVNISALAGGALGVGFGAGTEVEADLKPLGVLFWRMGSKALWNARARSDSAGVVRRITGYKQELATKVVPELERYREMKLELLRLNRAADFVKIEKLQAIIDREFPRTQLSLVDKKLVSDIDREIEAMIVTVFSDVDGSGRPSVEVKVEKGKIKLLQFTPRNIVSQLGGGIEGRHAHGTDAEKLNLMSDVGK